MTARPVLAFAGQEYTSGQLDGLACGVAEALRARGVTRGDRVALMSSNRPEWIAAVLGIWLRGASVALFSPSWKDAELRHAISVVRPSHAVGDHPLLAGTGLPLLHLDENPVRPEPGTARVPSEPGDEAVLVFSSGTTGLPKAVRHTHGSLRAAIGHWRDALELTGADRIQVTTPPAHILGLLNIVTALDLGIWMRLHPKFDLDAMLAAIHRDRITVEMAVAPIALAMANHPRLEDYDLSSLRFIMWGATPVTPSVAETVTRRTGVGWVPAYGASELPVIACNPVRGARLDSVGKVVPGVEMRIADGEIQLKSPSLMAGYLPEDETELAITADGWYRTGDIGYAEPGGWLHLTDRSKEMIKVRGLQVAPAEVEGVLLGHEAVTDAAVFGVPDDTDGEAVIAMVVLSGPAAPEELRAHVGERLASYKKPREILPVAAVPRLASGKALRRLLKDDYIKEHGGRTTVS